MSGDVGDVGDWAILLFWCLVVTGALVGVRLIARAHERRQGEDRHHINRYLELLGESHPPRRPRPARGQPLPPPLAREVDDTIAGVDSERVRRLMQEGVRQIEQDAVPGGGRTPFGRLWSLQDKWRR
jgi:hypothetical protein